MINRRQRSSDEKMNSSVILNLFQDLKRCGALSELSQSITELTTTMDNRVSDIKFRAHELSGLLQEIKTSAPSGPSDSIDIENLLKEVSENVQALEEVVNYFKTSENR